MRTNLRLVNKLCVGIDLHKDTMTICVLDPATGQERFEKIACKCRDKVVEFFGALPRPHVVAVESMGSYRWLWELLEPIVEKRVLADATQCRALAGRGIKTDRDDARNVADLLACGRLPLAWAPPTGVARLRDVTRHCHYLSRQHARVLHRVKSIMNMLNRPGPDRLKAPSLHKWLCAQRSKIPNHFVEQMEMAYDELVILDRNKARLDERIKAMIEAEPGFHASARRLMSFPGVGATIAATVLAEIGDFGRFVERDALTPHFAVASHPVGDRRDTVPRVPSIHDRPEVAIGRPPHDGLAITITMPQKRAVYYNVMHHPRFDQDGGRLIYFEGTYTTMFVAEKPTPTPRYEYNQIMYRLDLSDERLRLPGAAYMFSESAGQVQVQPQRSAAEDPDDVMAPPDSGLVLPTQQMEMVICWVEQGAPWQPHWSFTPPQRPTIPAVADKDWVRNPIDALLGPIGASGSAGY